MRQRVGSLRVGFLKIVIWTSDKVPEGYKKWNVPLLREDFTLLIKVSLFGITVFRIALT